MTQALLAPEEFARAWGTDALIRLPEKQANAPIPSDACEFLVRAGLPALIIYYSGVTESKITFCRLASGLSPILSQKTAGPPLPSEWSVYWVLGDEFFCNGAAWWCIHQENGHVVRIDVELGEPIELVNSSVAQFGSALLAAVSWAEGWHPSVAAWRQQVDRLERELQELDPASMRSDRSFWQVYLNFIREEGPDKGEFKKGARSSGRRAWLAGPW